jgi:GTPase Era involved in 16S rRNA processing
MWSITILGMPNMGKSTLLNALLADNLAIVNPRPQTTRHAILCLTDTPGLIGNPAYKMQEGMMDVVRSSVRDADVYLVVTDVYSGRGYDNWGEGVVESNNDDINDRDDEEGEEGMTGIGTDMLNRLRTSGRPVIVCVNKVGLVTAATAASSSSGNDINNTPTRAAYTIQKWRSMLPNAFAILPTCAGDGPNDVGVVALRSILLANEVDINIDVGASIRALGRPVPGMFPINNHDSDATTTTTTTIATTTMPILKSSSLSFDKRFREIIPIGPPLYHSDFFTDWTDRFCASELIREVLFTSLGKELPYCCEVRVETFDESRRYVDNDN